MAVLATVEKDPSAILVYTIRWAGWLEAGDTIDTGAVVWTVPTGVASITESATTTTTSIKLSGGTAGQVYLVRCKVTTVGGLTDTRTLQMMVNDR